MSVDGLALLGDDSAVQVSEHSLPGNLEISLENPGPGFELLGGAFLRSLGTPILTPILAPIRNPTLKIMLDPHPHPMIRSPHPDTTPTRALL